MTPERWEQVKQILDSALVLEPADRSNYLRNICGADSDLREEVESLLVSHSQAGTQFMKKPAVNLVGQFSTRVDTRLGPYRIIREIGHGGMGDVYRAIRDDGQYTKEVAIKVMRGGFETEFLRQRFLNERQILADLDHPNVARFLDGGTTEEGIPYLVMEFVEGIPIDQYCDAHRLTIAERLRLFREVCSAVQYAHQRLVIHRDIKPSNILVTEKGRPKLLDFGIAKILHPSRSAEATVAHPLTPEYASPEQVRGEPVTTAADVYSLGVLLYRLLTGRSPYPGGPKSPHQLGLAICHLEPEQPSAAILKSVKICQNGERNSILTPEDVSQARDNTVPKLRRRLTGDVDNIVLKALRKDPQRRYASVEQFSEDIQRHLGGLPIAAQKDSFRYRAGKFVGRHRIAVGGSALVALIMVAGVVGIIWEARIAKVNGQRAERRFNDVRKLANSLIFDLHDSIKDLPGSTPARKLLVSRALEYLDSLNQEAKGDPSLQRELAAAYQRIGDVQGQPRQANLGDQAGAALSYRKAIAIQEALLAGNPGSLEVRREIVSSYGRLSDLLRDMGDSAGSLENSRKEMASAQIVYSTNPADPANRLLFATYQMDYGYKQVTVGGERAPGLTNLRQGSTSLEQIVAENPQNRYARRVLGLSYSRTAEILRVSPQDRPQALDLYKKALAIKQELLLEDPNNTDYRRMIAYDQFNIAHLMGDMNDLQGTLELEREALSSFQQLALADPASVQFQQDIVEIQADIGATLLGLNHLPEAVQELAVSIATAEKMPGAQNVDLPVGRIVAKDQFELGKAHALMAFTPGTSIENRSEQCTVAESWFKKCLPSFERRQRSGNSDGPSATRLSEIQQARERCGRIVRRGLDTAAKR